MHCKYRYYRKYSENHSIEVNRPRLIEGGESHVKGAKQGVEFHFFLDLIFPQNQ